MYLMVEENPNCANEERVFSTSGEKRVVTQLHLDKPGHGAVWCDVAGVEEGGSFIQAFGQRVEDSSDGTAWLVFGGDWGLRLRPDGDKASWSLVDKNQWGLPFVVLDSSGSSIRFKP